MVDNGDSPMMASISSSLGTLRQIAMTSPEAAHRVVHDLEQIYQHYTAQVHPLPPPPRHATFIAPQQFPSFRPVTSTHSTVYKSTRAWREIVSVLGPNVRITDVRKTADVLSRSQRVPLTLAVRHHAGQLMDWFESNWEILSPGLRKCQPPRAV
jgi:hypothetical protein